MWLIVDILIAIVSVIPGVRAGIRRQPRTTDPGRQVERFRWLIYGVIGFGVLMLAVIGVMLWMAG
jgi:hypothetical protein